MNENKVREQLQQYIKENDVSAASVARSIGYSPSALSSWQAVKYDGDTTAITEAVEGFLQRMRERKAAPKEPIPFVQTSVVKKVHEVARICHLDGEIGVCYGPAGLGKTDAAKAYAKKNKDVILVEADLGLTAKTLFAKLHRAVGLDGEGNVHHMFEDVVEKLKGSGRMIVIDEAEHLPYRALELVRRIYDKAGIGILLIGMPKLIINLRGRKGQYAQLYSRVGVAVKLDLLRPADIEEIVAAAIPDSNGVWKAFNEAAEGNARILSKLIQNTKRVAKINKTGITPEIVKETAKMLLM